MPSPRHCSPIPPELAPVENQKRLNYYAKLATPKHDAFCKEQRVASSVNSPAN
jgi:hypothetical protein